MFPENTVLLLRRSLRAGFRQVRFVNAGAMLLTGSVLLVQAVLMLMLSAAWVQQLLISKSVIHVEFVPNAASQQIQELLSSVELLPYVADARFVTREQAYMQEQARSAELSTFLDTYALQNPFADRMDVLLTSPSAESQFFTFLGARRWQSIIDPSLATTLGERSEQTARSMELASTLRLIAAGFLGISLLLLFFLMLDGIRKRLQMRRDAVIVGKLAGATDHALAMPFAAELGLLLLFSVIVSVVLLSILAAASTFFLQGAAESAGQLFSFLRLSLPSVLFLEIIAVPFIAFAVARVGLRLQGGSMALRL